MAFLMKCGLWQYFVISFVFQINWQSSFIDGSFLYGKSLVRTEFLREPGTGKMACEDRWGKFPLKNDVGLPYNPFSFKYSKSEDLWRKMSYDFFAACWMADCLVEWLVAVLVGCFHIYL